MNVQVTNLIVSTFKGLHAGYTNTASSGGGTTFDYYISTTGSDSNPGTQSQPWSINAINSKQSTYAGKKVGLLDGVYNVYSYVQAGSFNQPGLVINGGPSSSQQTLIAAVNPRQAILTAANPSGGGYPTNECAIIGQGQYNALPPNPGNTIIDGLYITRGYQMGIAFYMAGQGITTGVVEGGVVGIEIRNCEVYDIAGVYDDNVAGIFFQGVTGAWVHNNKIHGIQPAPDGGNQDDCAAFYIYNSRSCLYEYNTAYDCNNTLFDKASGTGNHTFRYNYLEAMGLYPQNALHGGTGGNTGDVAIFHNNIIKSNSNLWDGSLGSSQSTESLLFYNNTCQWTLNNTGIFYPTGASGANVQMYNNIFCTNPDYEGILRTVSGALALSNYNLFPSAVSSSIYITLWAAPGYSDITTSYTKANSIYDSHSVLGSPTFVSPGLLSPTGYQLTSSSLGKGTGYTNGTGSSGAACDMGAWGGASPPTQIGCNF